jgi:ribose transport system substrate-binding protein
MCLGAQKAIGDAGKSKDIFIASVDGEMGTLKAIMTKDSNYAVTGLNNADQIGRAGFYRMMSILAGATAPQKSVLPSPIITVDNAVKYYNEGSTF